MLEFSLSQVQVKKQQPRPFGPPPSDGNNKLPASAFSPKHESVSESARRGSNPLAVVADFEHRRKSTWMWDGVAASMPGLCKELQQHQWSSGRMHRCHRCDPGSIPADANALCHAYVFAC